MAKESLLVNGELEQFTVVPIVGVVPVYSELFFF